jgi:hypothetical protein
MRHLGVLVGAATIGLASCSPSGHLSALENARIAPQNVSLQTSTGLYQPMAVGARWKYTCRDIKGGGENGGNPFTIEDKVIGATTVGNVKVFEYARQAPQVPSAPLKIVTTVMLLGNEAHGDLWIYGYRKGNTIFKVRPTRIISDATPRQGTKFNYPGPTGKIVPRFFFGIVPTNPTPLGTFTVADYEESGNTHDYGYARGMGVAEEDHGPNFEVDCLIESFHL